MLWGGISGSAVIIGAIFSLLIPIKKKIIGYIMSFGTGVLMGAASYELLEDSVREGGIKSTAIGFIVGAVVFTILNILISRKGGASRKRSNSSQAKGSGLAIFLGTCMDAVPESIMIGASLIENTTVSWLLVIAIFISNIPEGLSSTEGLKADGFSKRKIIFLWTTVFIISALSALGGYLLLEGASDATMAFIASFAGGGIIAMVTSTMMPEAYEEGGSIVGLIASLGLLVSLILNAM